MKRIVIFALLACAAFAIGLSLFQLVWFRVQHPFVTIEARFLGANTQPFRTSLAGPYIWISVVCAMVAIYYLIRISVTTLTLLIGVPYSRLVQWRSPRSAYLQGAAVLACAIAMLFVTPDLVADRADFARFMPPTIPIESGELVLTDLVRAPGGYVLIGAVVLSLGGTFLVSRIPELAAVQGWVIAESSADEPDEPVRRERPMERARPMSTVGVDANPFRAGPQSDLGAKLVKTARAPEPVKVVSDQGAERDKPKLLG
jgi:hypothetical protein